jgi:hypothetical protein
MDAKPKKGAASLRGLRNYNKRRTSSIGQGRLVHKATHALISVLRQLHSLALPFVVQHHLGNLFL